MAQKRKK